MFENFKLIFRLITLDKKAMNVLAQKKSATLDGILILFLAGVSLIPSNLETLLTMEQFQSINLELNLSNLIFLAIFFVISTLFYIATFFLIARLLGGDGKFIHYFRVFACSSIIAIPNLFVNLAIFTNAWTLIILYQMLKTLNNFPPLKALLALLTVVLSLVALVIILS